MVFTLGIYIYNSISACFISPRANDELGMSASNSFENFRVVELPCLIRRIPGAAIKRLIYVTEAMKE